MEKEKKKNAGLGWGVSFSSKFRMMDETIREGRGEEKTKTERGREKKQYNSSGSSEHPQLSGGFYPGEREKPIPCNAENFLEMQPHFLSKRNDGGTLHGRHTAHVPIISHAHQYGGLRLVMPAMAPSPPPSSLFLCPANSSWMQRCTCTSQST